MTYQYLTVAAFKEMVDIGNTYADTDIALDLVAATVDIDKQTGRRFQPFIGTRELTAPKTGSGAERVLFKYLDLLEVTALKTDDGTHTYPYTWTVGDWYLGPEDVAYTNPPGAYYWIARRSASAYGWPYGVPQGLQITGKWGYYDSRKASGATLAANVDVAVLLIPVSSPAPFEIGQTILLGSEQLYIKGKTDNTSPTNDTLTVEARGANGTTAAAHTSGVGIEIYTYPEIDVACQLLTHHYLRRRKTPDGVTGNPDIGLVRLAMNDPDVKRIMGQVALGANG